mgnify:CR=1 FL=1
MIALPKNNTLIIPDSILAASLKDKMDNTVLDVNIPEFKLRIIENGVVKHAISVRTGQYRKRYLEMSGRVNDLRTKTGEGTIVRHAKNPDFYNPVNGKRFTHTNRDDKKRTVMPQIPWIETEINGLRHGQMIHPTTNPKSLGKAYSNI